MTFKMKYDIKKQYLTSNSDRRSGIKMPKVGFMVAHDTGNENSTAAGNVGYYERSRNEQSASAHIFVDDKEIIECVPFLTGTPEKAWHVIYNVTKDNAMYGDDANDIAGGVELCWGSKINAAEAYKRYVWVLAYACYKHKLNPAKAIVGHKVLDPARKIDPDNGLKHMGSQYSYAKLLADVVAEYNECIGQTATPVKAPTAVTGKTYKIQSGDTFWGIAQRTNGVTVQDLIKWNPTVNATDLKVGQVINISQPATVSKPVAKPAPVPSKKKWDFADVVLRKGDKGSNVLKMQQGLCEAAFYPERGAKNNGCDSSFGPATQNAVKRFQSVYCNPADGIFGPATRKALENLLNK